MASESAIPHETERGRATTLDPRSKSRTRLRGGDVRGPLRALRGLRRDPRFSALVVGVLAIGIGSVTALSAVVSQVVLRPLPVNDQDELVVAWANNRARDAAHFPYFVSVYEAALNGLPAIESLAATYSWRTAELVVQEPDGLPTTIRAAATLGDFFGVLEVEPVIGRVTELEEDVRSPDRRVAVISEGYWARRFARDPGALGRTITTQFGALTVVGVLPGDFDYPQGAELWTPMRPIYGERLPPLLELDLVGRLAPDASVASVAPQLEALTRADPELDRIYGASDPVVTPFEKIVLGDMDSILLVLLAGAVLVMLIAVFDAANLVLVRAESRMGSLAIRRALGAGRRQLFGDALWEAAVLGGLAAITGAMLAFGAIRLLVPLTPAGLPRLTEVRGLDPAAWGVATATALLVIILAVLLPSWRAAWADPATAMRAGRATTRTSRIRRTLVSGQVGVTVWVLVVGVLLVRTVTNLQSLEIGFDADGLTAVSLEHRPSDLPEEAIARQLGDALEHIGRTPGVLGVTHLLSAPLPGSASYQSIVFLEGQAREDALAENPYLFLQVIDPAGLDVLGVPIVQGRGFQATDDLSAAPVVVVNETAARRLWPGRSPMGRQVRLPVAAHLDTWWTVVGVTGDTRYDDFLEPEPSIFFPIGQFTSFLPNYVLVRSDGTGPSVLRAVTDALAASTPAIGAKAAFGVRERLDVPLARPRFAARMLTLLAVIALGLAAVGIHGIMSFLVRSRRREIGVRLACGATPLGARGLILREGLFLAGAGTAVGTLAAWTGGPLVESLLYGIEGSDPASITVGAVIAMTLAAAACWIPARRAADVDPATVLGSD